MIDRTDSQIGFRHSERLLDMPKVIIVFDDLLTGQWGISDVALQPISGFDRFEFFIIDLNGKPNLLFEVFIIPFIT